MKILRRNYGHRNLILFLVLSLIYLQAIYSLSIGQTLFSLLSFRSFFLNHYLIIILTVITGGMTISLKKHSEKVLLVCLIVIVGKNFYLLSHSFNKLTLALSFIYLIFAFYFFITWELEVTMASFNPNFSSYDLEKESRFRLHARIFENEEDKEGKSALITNLDEGSCFLLLPDNLSFELNPAIKYLLESHYEGVCFRHRARIVASYDRGVGLVYEEFPDARVSWSELYKVCSERGLMG